MREEIVRLGEFGLTRCHFSGADSRFPLYLLSAKEAEQKDAAAIGAISFAKPQKKQKGFSFVLIQKKQKINGLRIKS